jgi:hypothetical protein
MGRINCGGGDGGEPARSPSGRRAFVSQIGRDRSVSLRPYPATFSTSDLGPIRWTMALTVQRSVLEFSFRIRANLLRRHVGITIRHNSGARQRTTALQSWTLSKLRQLRSLSFIDIRRSFHHGFCVYSKERRRRATLSNALSAQLHRSAFDSRSAAQALSKFERLTDPRL